MPVCTMPLKRLLKDFVGSLSWGISFDFSGLYMDMLKIWSVGTIMKRTVP